MLKLKARMKYLKGVRHTREYSTGEEDRGTLGLGCERASSLLLSPYRLEEKPAVHPLGICSAG